MAGNCRFSEQQGKSDPRDIRHLAAKFRTPCCPSARLLRHLLVVLLLAAPLAGTLAAARAQEPATAAAAAAATPFRSILDPACPADTEQATPELLRLLLPRVAALAGLPWDGSLPSLRYLPLTAPGYRQAAHARGLARAGAFYFGRTIFYGCAAGGRLSLPLLAHELCHHLQWINTPGSAVLAWTRPDPAPAAARERHCYTVQARFAAELAG